MIKLIAIDIDGTLINSKKQLTTETIKAIEYAKNKDVYIVLCTGRPVQGIKELYNKLSLSSPIISYNGAVVLDGLDGNTIYECSLSGNDTRDIMTKGNELNVTVATWFANNLYTNKLNDLAYKYSDISGVPPMLIENTKDLFLKGATKVLYYDTEENIKAIETSLKDTFSSEVVFHTSRPYFLEFVNSKVSKAIAIQKLCNYLNLKHEETMAIGDGFNDLAMLEYAKTSVAMGNAPKEIQNLCDYVTASCDEDGVAKAIYKFI